MECIIFDMDGTLVDSNGLHARAWERTLAKWGHVVGYDELRTQMGKGGDQLLPKYLTAEEMARDGEAIDKERGALYKKEYMGEVQPFPGVAALFEMILGQGTRIALGSSGKQEEIEHYRKLLGIDGMEMVVTTSEDAAKSKPHPDIFTAALKRLGAPAERVLAVGDTPYDAQAAAQAGLRSVGVLCGGFDEATLRGAGCLEVFGGPDDMVARFAGSLLSR